MKSVRLKTGSSLAIGMLALAANASSSENTLADYQQCALSEMKGGAHSLNEIKQYCTREYTAYAATLPDEYRETDLARLDAMMRKVLGGKKKQED